MNGYIDWNIYLNDKGGPNHVGNFCDAPVMCDTENDTIDIKLFYYDCVLLILPRIFL